MPTPTLTSACEYASGKASKASSATYLRYFMVNLPCLRSSDSSSCGDGAKPRTRGGAPLPHKPCDLPELEVLQLSVSSEAPTHSNSDGGEKLRKTEWLISAILREINQLGRVEESAFASYGFGGRAGLQAGVETGNHEGFSPRR